MEQASRVMVGGGTSQGPSLCRENNHSTDLVKGCLSNRENVSVTVGQTDKSEKKELSLMLLSACVVFPGK